MPPCVSASEMTCLRARSPVFTFAPTTDFRLTGELYQLLAKVFAFQHAYKGMRHRFNPLGNVFPGFQEPLFVPEQEVSHCCLVLTFEIIEQKSFDPGTGDQNSSEMAQTDIGFIKPVSPRNRSDNNNTTELVEIEQCRT